ncbi:MAG: ABC transporter ATP-binding protein [Alphaproteobacteria bacterium]
MAAADGPAADAPALDVEGLEVRFRAGAGETLAVDGVSLSVDAGAILGLIGESGSGKSATLLALAGLLPETARVGGTIRLLGRTLTDLPERERARLRGHALGMIFQDPGGSLNPVLSVGSQIDEVVLVHQGRRGRAARRETEALLAQVGIGDPRRRADAYPHQLSGGMKQRVAIAAALAARPAAILADEPTTALDATVQAQIFALLTGLVERERMALLLVTHDLAVAAAVADRIAVLYAGRIVEEGPARNIAERPAHPYSRALAQATLPFAARAPTGGARLPELTGQMPAAGGAGCAFAARCPLAIARCREETPPLAPWQAGRVACWRAGEA